MSKLPRLDHVKYVHAKGNVYVYFNTGQKKPDGQVIYTRLPHPSSVGFYDSYAAMVGARTKRAKIGYLVANLVRDFEVAMEKRGDLAEGTKKLYRITNKRVVELLGEFPVNDLQPEDVQFVLDNKMTGTGAHNIFLALVGILYTWGRKRGKTRLEPTKDIEPLKGGEHEPWPQHVLDAGLSAEHDRTRLAINLLYFSGQRISDVVRMRWNDIRNGAITLVQKKTGKELTIPIHRDLAAELARTPKQGITILINHLSQPISEGIIRKELKRFTAELGHETVPHGLRKNAVNALLEAGCSVAEVAAITGQSYRIVERYAAKVNRTKLGKAAILKLENMTGTGKRPRKLSRDS